MIHPVEQCFAIFRVGAAHEGHQIETPSLRFGVAGTPDVENEERGMDFAGRGPLKQPMEFVGIELSGTVEPGAHFPDQAGKRTNEREDHLVGRGFAAGSWLDRVHAICFV